MNPENTKKTTEMTSKELRKIQNRIYYEKTKLKRGKVIRCSICDGKYSSYTKSKHMQSQKHSQCVMIIERMKNKNL